MFYLLFGRFLFKSSPVENSTSSSLFLIGFFLLLLILAFRFPSLILPTPYHLLFKKFIDSIGENKQTYSKIGAFRYPVICS